MKKLLKNAISKARRYPFSMCCIGFVWILSLTPFFPETPFDNVMLIDKWTHFIMYGGTGGVMWMEYLYRNHRANYGRLWLWAGVGLSLMGGLLELLQAYCTTTRSGEWLDFLADSIGALGVCAIGSLMVLLFQKRERH